MVMKKKGDRWTFTMQTTANNSKKASNCASPQGETSSGTTTNAFKKLGPVTYER